MKLLRFGQDLCLMIIQRQRRVAMLAHPEAKPEGWEAIGIKMSPVGAAHAVHFFGEASFTSNCITASIAASALLPGRLWLLQKIENTNRFPCCVCP